MAYGEGHREGGAARCEGEGGADELGGEEGDDGGVAVVKSLDESEETCHVAPRAVR